jgi:hypothetical protein
MSSTASSIPRLAPLAMHLARLRSSFERVPLGHRSEADTPRNGWETGSGPPDRVSLRVSVDTPEEGSMNVKTPRRRNSATGSVAMDDDLSPTEPPRDDVSSQRAAAGPTSDDIARRAYELYERRGREDGRDRDDWLQAERELRLAIPGGAADSGTAGRGSGTDQ